MGGLRATLFFENSDFWCTVFLNLVKIRLKYLKKNELSGFKKKTLENLWKNGKRETLFFRNFQIKK